jgi:phospholipase A1
MLGLMRLNTCLSPILLACACLPAHATEAVALDCQTKSNPVERLACYDARFPVQSPEASAPSKDTVPPAQLGQALAEAEDPSTHSTLSRIWEIGPVNRRDTFVVRTYMPNYVLPLHYTSNLNRQPSSPTRGPSPQTPNYRNLEAKYQISLRAKVAQDLLLPDANLWLAYTQQSMWQVWNHRDSAPFRNTDYQPEVIYVVPVPKSLDRMPGDWHWRLVKLGAVHESNGQADPLSRSWNRLYAEAAFEREDFSVQLRVNKRLFKEGSDQDDNPDMAHFMGDGEARLSWLPGLSTASLTWRTNLHSLRTRALQLDWTYPVNSDKPEGLRWYAQLFTGYGETLIDYNFHQNSIGLGLSLFQF